MNQSIEQAAIIFANKCRAANIKAGFDYPYDELDMRNAFEEGAKWQAEQSPWISVNDRLPEENANVFFILTWRGIHREYYAGSYIKGKWRTEHRNYAPSSFWGVVTHWIPMPKINE